MALGRGGTLIYSTACVVMYIRAFMLPRVMGGGEQASRNVYTPILLSVCCGVFRVVGRLVLGGPLVRSPCVKQASGLLAFS